MPTGSGETMRDMTGTIRSQGTAGLSLSDTDAHVELTEAYGAHSYHPLRVVLSAGEGAWVTDLWLTREGAITAANFGALLGVECVLQAGSLVTGTRSKVVRGVADWLLVEASDLIR